MTRAEYERRSAAFYTPYEAAKAAWLRHPKSEAHRWATAAAFEVWNYDQSALFGEYCESQRQS